MNIQFKTNADSERQIICNRASDNISRLTSELNRFRSQRADLQADVQNTRNELSRVNQELADARMAATAASVGSRSIVGTLGSLAVGIATSRRVGDLSQRVNRLQASLRNMDFELRQVIEEIDNREDLIRQARAAQSRHNC